MYFFIAFILLIIVLLIPSENRFLSYIKAVMTVLLVISLIIMMIDAAAYWDRNYHFVEKTSTPTSNSTTTTTTNKPSTSSGNVSISIPAPVPGANVIQYPLCVSGINPPCYQIPSTTSNIISAK